MSSAALDSPASRKSEIEDEVEDDIQLDVSDEDNTMENQYINSPNQPNLDNTNFKNQTPFGNGAIGNKLNSEKSKFSSFEGNPEASTNTIWADVKLCKIYKILQDFNNHGVNVVCPRISMLGNQSTGKTSLVSNLTNLVMGSMKDGIGSRQITKLKLINNQDLPPGYKKITCQGHVCADEMELQEMMVKHANNLEGANTFDEKMLVIEVESCDVPELTFTDGVGFIEKVKDANECELINKINGELLNQTDENGNAVYSPVIIESIQDAEAINHSTSKRLDEITENYPNKLNGFKNTDWKQNAIYIINKCDNKASRGCDEWISLFRDYEKFYDKKMFFTAVNPNREDFTSDSIEERCESNKKAQQAEKVWWSDILAKFTEKPNYHILRKYINKYCGMQLVRNKFTEMMKQRVEIALGTLESKINETVCRKAKKLKIIDYKLAYSDPTKAIITMQRFTSELLQNLRRIYSGIMEHKIIAPTNFRQDLNDILNSKKYKENKKAVEWFEKYLISIESLKLKFKKTLDVSAYNLMAETHHGAQSFYRLEKLWSKSVAFMEFPKYKDSKINSKKNRYTSTRTGDTFDCLRNYVKKASRHIENGACWFAVANHVLLNRNLKSAYDYTFNNFFGQTGEVSDTESEYSSSTSSSDEKKDDINQDAGELENNVKLSKTKKNKSKKKSKRTISSNEYNYHLANMCLQQIEKQHDLMVDSMLLRCSHIQSDVSDILTKNSICQLANFGVFINEKLKIEQAFLENESKQSNKVPPKDSDSLVFLDSEAEDDDDSEAELIPGQNIKENQNKNAKNEWNSVDCYQQCYSENVLFSLSIPNEKPQVIRRLGKLYWSTIINHTINVCKNYYTNQIVYPVKQCDVYKQAVEFGAKSIRINHLIKQITDITGQIPGPIKQFILDNDVDKQITPGLLQLQPEDISPKFFSQYKQLKKARQICAQELRVLREKKETGLKEIATLRNDI